MNLERKKGDIIITFWIAFGVVIVLGFCVFSMIIGRDALNGYIENGHYFVGNHGEYVEVSERIWRISCVFEILFWISLPLAPIGAFIISNIQEKLERRKNRFE